ncbi:hypothetical protein BC937DRAFT_87744 [Endogone sp. FLAS-F59071]|nr:hypothetical protein BC937DRAFT_87744 [Endogone sp. FLAS-F59071]|eukprot:RUS19273.1 hypothetical protein BC937DRAFT_87744 [Endogone sp. FLAS-F59071]
MPSNQKPDTKTFGTVDRPRRSWLAGEKTPSLSESEMSDANSYHQGVKCQKSGESALPLTEIQNNEKKRRRKRRQSRASLKRRKGKGKDKGKQIVALISQVTEEDKFTLNANDDLVVIPQALPEIVLDWESNDVLQFLKANEEYRKLDEEDLEVIYNHKVFGSDFIDLTEANLIAIGLKLGPVKRIIGLVNDLKKSKGLIYEPGK